jgi:cbb3-type cytochrome oxidase subunit 3
MRLSELMSHMSPTTMTEIALVLFLAVFAAVGVRAYRKSQRAVHDRALMAPLADDAEVKRER